MKAESAGRQPLNDANRPLLSACGVRPLPRAEASTMQWPNTTKASRAPKRRLHRKNKDLGATRRQYREVAFVFTPLGFSSLGFGLWHLVFEALRD